jgi:hypothetical protein
VVAQILPLAVGGKQEKETQMNDKNIETKLNPIMRLTAAAPQMKRTRTTSIMVGNLRLA